MQIKRFVADTLKEATDQMRSELGPDAIILNTRKVANNRFLNFVGKDMLEITAAIDEHPLQAGKGNLSAGSKFSSAYQQAKETYTQVKPQATIDELKNLTKQFEKRTEALPTSAPVSIARDQADIQVLRGEMEEMRTVLMQIAEHLKYSKMPAMPIHVQEAYLNLVQNGVNENLAADIVQSIYARLDGEQLNDKQTVERALIAEAAKQFRTVPIPHGKMKKTYIVVLVGPTGVGKTTSIAKLAAIHKLIHRQNVGLITTDTYRIGAIEQLKTFASIADIPMEVVYKPSEVEDALKGFKKKDIVFIDTVGRNQRAKKELTELRRFIEAAGADEVHLVLNVSTNQQTLLDIIRKFKPLKPSRLLFSKMDEALSLGGILNVIKQSQLPISYVTTGQVVPDDILAVDANKLASMICNGAIAHA